MPQTFNVGSRSLFVSITAWAFIVLGVAASGRALIHAAATTSVLPPAIALALSITTLATAVGLLLRLEWARRTFIPVAVLAVVANLAGLWFQQAALGDVAAAVRITLLTASVSICVWLAWLVGHLNTELVRHEFA